MNQDIKVSVILPCYNSESQLEKCLESILNQTLKEIELICIDDGSTDNTLKILNDYVTRDKRVIVLTQENQYAGVARNKGLAVSSGKYLFFMDSDDYLQPTAMEKVYIKSEFHEADICIFGAGTLDLTNGELNYAYPIKAQLPKKLPFSRNDVGKNMMTICHMAAWNKLYNKAFIINSGLDFQPLQRSNDVFFCQTTIIEAKRITVVDEWLYTRTINSGTSLVETMDENPYPFYESSKKIKQYFIDKGLYEHYKKQILQRCLYSAIHVLEKLKTREKFLEVITFLKEVVFIEFEIWENRALFSLNVNSTKNLFFIMETPTKELQHLRFNHETKLLEKDIKVSVIIPCYNAERFSHECLDSLLNQSLKEIEIICVDDGSTDQTIEILSEYAEKDLMFESLTGENQYAGVARNRGMEIAKGKYLSFLDSDDFFEPTMLEEMYIQCEKDGADFCITGGATYDMSTNEVTYKYKVRHDKLPSTIPFSYKDIPNDIFSASFIAPWSKLYKKSFIDEHQLKYQALQRSNDYFFTQSAMVLADRITIVDRCLFTYRIGTSTSLVETMDQNPLCFYDANKALYNLINEHGIYNEVKLSFKRSALSGAHHALSMLKTKEAWLEVAMFIKDQYIPEFQLDENPKEYTNLASNLEMLDFLTSSTATTIAKHSPILRKDELAVVEIKPEFEYKLNHNNKKVSVIIPVYNGEQYLEGCLRSVLNQSLKDIEIICINDGSSDSTLEILTKLSDEDNRITVLTQENSGQSSARNAGLEIAQGEYIMFVDSDDLLVKMSLEKLYRQAKYHDVDDLFCEGKAFFDPIHLHTRHKQQLKNYEYGRSQYQISSGREILKLMLKRKQFRTSINTRLFKRSFLEENMLRFTNESIHEEKIFTMRSLNVAERVMIYKEPLYFVRIHPESVTLKENAVNRFYSWGQCLIEALTRSANNVHCEHRKSFISLTQEYQKQMLNKFDEIKKKESQISNEMLMITNNLIEVINKDNSGFFQEIRKKFKISYAYYVLRDFRLNGTYINFETERDYANRLHLLHGALINIDDSILNTALDKINLDFKNKSVVFNFKKIGNITEISKIYPMIVDGTDIVVKGQDGEVLEKLSNVTATINLFKPVDSIIKLSGKLDTLFDFSKFNLYFENDKKERINLMPKKNVHDQEKILGLVSKAPFSFSCCLTQEFLSKRFYLIANYKEVSKKINLSFIEHSIIQNNVQGSHLLINNSAIYYEKDKKTLFITTDKAQMEYFKLLSTKYLSKQELDFSDLEELQPYLKKEYENQNINLFIATNGELNSQMESVITYYVKYKPHNEKNYLVISRQSKDYNRLKKEGVMVIDYKGFNYSKLLLVAKKIFVYNPNKSLLSSLEEIQKALPVSFDLITPWEPWDFINMQSIQDSAQKEFAGKHINLFMDRVNKADDNSVTLIEYFEKNKTEKELNYFILNKSSTDFKHLQAKGIKVVEHRSFEHLSLLMVANNVITSQIMEKNIAPFDKQYGGKINYFFNYKLSYIQPGIIERNMSEKLRKSNINVDLFITSGNPEFESLISEDYEYNDEVVLTGLPRFDKLEKSKGRTIVIAPTWNKCEFLKNDSPKERVAFKKSEYFKKWNSILTNTELVTMAKRNGYELVFLSHPKMRNTNWMFNTNNVKVTKFEETYADIINNAACLITDRSSIYNDFAYVEKQVFYYAPEDNKNFGKGYFDYETDGFGPVLDDEESLVAEVILSMENGFEVKQKYIDRKNTFFAYTDRNNSKRVYDAIKELDKKFTHTTPKIQKKSTNISSRSLSARIKCRIKRKINKWTLS